MGRALKTDFLGVKLTPAFYILVNLIITLPEVGSQKQMLGEDQGLSWSPGSPSFVE
jgi:hypothetical protein